MRVGEYGALENNKFVDVILSESTFNSTPATLTLLPYNYWQANTSYTAGTNLYYLGNTYVTTGNAYGALFSNANVTANISLISTQSVVESNIVGYTPELVYRTEGAYTTTIFDGLKFS
jgi:hypothetical protein